MTRLLFLFLTGFFLSHLYTEEPPKPKSHTLRNIEGWTVEIDDRLFLEENNKLGETALRLLGNQLFSIAFLLPGDKVEILRKVRVRIDLTHGKLTSAQYHPSPD